MNKGLYFTIALTKEETKELSNQSREIVEDLRARNLECPYSPSLHSLKSKDRLSVLAYWECHKTLVNDQSSWTVSLLINGRFSLASCCLLQGSPIEAAADIAVHMFQEQGWIFNQHLGPSLDDFLRSEGIFYEVDQHVKRRTHKNKA